MALLTPDYTYTLNGVPVRVKLIPDGAKWTNAAAAVKAKTYAGDRKSTRLNSSHM